jgi:hypothetical protein
MGNLITIAASGALATSLRVLKAHIAVSALDLWDDADHNGRPDTYLARIKAPNRGENEPVQLGDPATVNGKIIQWIWMPSLPPGSDEDWSVEIDVAQADPKTGSMRSLPDFPMSLSGAYPPGQSYGMFQTWFRLVTP